MKMIVSIIEARTQMELDTKSRAKEKGLHGQSYFNFNLFVENFFAKLMPQQLKREKYVFNFLWTLAHIEESNQLVEVFIKLLKGVFGMADLTNLMMVKDFVKQHLMHRAKLQYVDLSEQGGKFEHQDSLVSLARRIVLNYDDTFKVLYQEKFLVMKGDVEYMTLFNFIGAATKSFRELRDEGHTPRLKDVQLRSPAKNLPKEARTDHLIKCYGTGLIQDRSKLPKDDLKWFLWSDYKQREARHRELTLKEVGDFFSIDLDQKVQRMKMKSNQKNSNRACSPVPFKNLSERTKGVVEEDLNVPGRKSTQRKINFMDGQSAEKSDVDEFIKKLKPDRDNDLLIFEKFDSMPRHINAGLQDTSVMQAVRKYDDVQRKATAIKDSTLRSQRIYSETDRFIQEALEEKLFQVSKG
jgi:hypothetical protein